MSKLSFGQRIVSYLLESIGKGLWAFRPNLMKDIVEQNGALPSLMWFLKNMPQYESTLSKWGALRTHFLSSAISAINGCAYCTHGHAYAFQLHYFKENNSLFPIDEYTMMAYCNLSTPQTITKLKEILSDKALKKEAPYFDILLKLFESENIAAKGDTEKRMQHLIDMMSYLNKCGICARTKYDEAHDPINKDEKLKEKYQKERKKQA